MLNRAWMTLTLMAICPMLTNCGISGGGNLGGPSVEERNAQIASEPTGDFYYGRRYYIQKTRFWGYLRQPRQPWSAAKLVVFRESKQLTPDRMPEVGPTGQAYGFDQNCEYKIRGYFSGRQVYEPNSNQILPEFMLTGYTLVNRNPGWLFRPDDRYDPYRITMIPR